jgi:hypothetical protein
MLFTGNFSDKEIDALVGFLHALKLRRKWKEAVLDASPNKVSKQRILNEDMYSWEAQDEDGEEKESGGDEDEEKGGEVVAHVVTEAAAVVAHVVAEAAAADEGDEVLITF